MRYGGSFAPVIIEGEIRPRADWFAGDSTISKPFVC
jgi:hypothetical protein